MSDSTDGRAVSDSEATSAERGSVEQGPGMGARTPAPPCFVCAICGAIEDDQPVDLAECPNCGSPRVPPRGSGVTAIGHYVKLRRAYRRAGVTRFSRRQVWEQARRAKRIGFTFRGGQA